LPLPVDFKRSRAALAEVAISTQILVRTRERIG
jgi:hypothetical protein